MRPAKTNLCTNLIRYQSLLCTLWIGNGLRVVVAAVVAAAAAAVVIVVVVVVNFHANHGDSESD